MLKKTISALAISLALAPVALAQDLPSPEGVWQIESRDSRYRVEMCGEDEEALCGTLIWLAQSARSDENLQYMDSMVIDHARPTGDGVWRGNLHLWGHTANGTITQTNADTIELQGCAFFIVCRTYTLHRHAEG